MGRREEEEKVLPPAQALEREICRASSRSHMKKESKSEEVGMDRGSSPPLPKERHACLFHVCVETQASPDEHGLVTGQVTATRPHGHDLRKRARERRENTTHLYRVTVGPAL